jgi:ADP-ribosylglycohydrolase
MGLGRKKGPPIASEELVNARKRGALLGLAVGDALGTTAEWKRAHAPDFPQLTGGPQVDMRGGGPFSLRVGQVTDDTQMACALASMLKEHGRYDVIETAKAYARWLPLAFDAGEQTRAALTLVTEGVHAELAGRRIWLEGSQRPAGNGSLMRTAPIGVMFSSAQAQRIEASVLDSAITHFDFRCQLACVVFNAAIAAAIVSPKEKAEPGDLLKAAEADLVVAASQLGKAHPNFVLKVQDAARELREDLRLAQVADPELYGPELNLHLQMGFVRTTFRLAFWHLCHAPSFEAALIDVVNRGGDTDTNAAVTGALLGAVHGAAAIPEYWGTTVLEARPAFAYETGPLWTEYHPKRLLEYLAKDDAPKQPAPSFIIR